VQSSIVLGTIDEKEGRTEDAAVKSQTFNRQADQKTRLKKKKVQNWSPFCSSKFGGAVLV
jgi:hypothetical protein